MRIKKVSFWTEHIDLSRPYTIAYKTQYSVENIFVKIELSNGITGFGVASPAVDVTGESADDCRQALENWLEPILIQQDIRHINLLCRKIQNKLVNAPSACAAIDIALHDAWSKYLNQPLVNLLGKVHEILPTSITIGIKPTIAEAVEEAKEYLERGFKIIKLKVGINLEQDIEITHKIKEAIGDRMKIRVDANQGFTTVDLLNYLQKTESVGLEFVEQPFKPKAIQEMQALPLSIRKVMTGDESLQKTIDALTHSAMPQPFGIYNIKLMKCGGVAASQAIAQIANLANIDLMWGCMDESCVSIAAALHAAFAAQNTKYLDLDGSLDLARDPFKGGFVLENGLMRLTDNIGLGVENQM